MSFTGLLGNVMQSGGQAAYKQAVDERKTSTAAKLEEAKNAAIEARQKRIADYQFAQKKELETDRYSNQGDIKGMELESREAENKKDRANKLEVAKINKTARDEKDAAKTAKAEAKNIQSALKDISKDDIANVSISDPEGKILTGKRAISFLRQWSNEGVAAFKDKSGKKQRDFKIKYGGWVPGPETFVDASTAIKSREKYEATLPSATPPVVQAAPVAGRRSKPLSSFRK